MVLLQMNSLVNMSRLLASAGLSPADLTAYCGFVWGFMFEVGTYAVAHANCIGQASAEG